MYIYQKRSKNRQVLSGRGKVCPSCKSSKIVLTEPGKDRTTFTCQKCGSISTFTNKPDLSKPKKQATKPVSAITLRDRTVKTEDSRPTKVLANESMRSILEVIRKAMKDTMVVSFDYIAADDKKSSRTVEPYKITSKKGEMILFAHDLEGSSIRIFKIRNMSYVEPQPYAYEPRYDIEDKLKEDDG